MTLNDWLTLAAIIVGPLVAVGITLWIEARRRERDSRVIVLRQLMVSRHLPGDPLYSAAVNLVPVEFNYDPGVMAAYKEYQEAIRQVPGADPAFSNHHPSARHRPHSHVAAASRLGSFNRPTRPLEFAPGDPPGRRGRRPARGRRCRRDAFKTG